MRRNHRIPSAVLAALLSAGCAKEPPEASPAATPAQAVAPPAAAPPDSGAVAPDPPDPAALLAVAPELTLRGATLILSHTPPGLPVEAMAEQGFVLATAGFSRARPEDLSELAGLFTRLYASLPAPDGEWMPSYMDRVRKGDVTEAERARGRRLLTDGVTRLSAADRERLQSILERAIVDGVAERQSAARRTADYREIPRTHLAPGPGSSAGSAPPSPTRMAQTMAEPVGDGRGEAYWRRRMDTARARVVTLEAEVTRLDQEATGKAIWDTSSGGCNVPRTPWAVEVKDPVTLKCLQDSQNRDQIGRTKHGQALQALDAARQRLAAARKAVDDLEDEARRAGALPGWTR